MKTKVQCCLESKYKIENGNPTDHIELLLAVNLMTKEVGFIVTVGEIEHPFNSYKDALTCYEEN